MLHPQTVGTMDKDLYSSNRDESAVSDVKILDGDSCVPAVTCTPVSDRAALSQKPAKVLDKKKTPDSGEFGASLKIKYGMVLDSFLDLSLGRKESR